MRANKLLSVLIFLFCFCVSKPTFAQIVSTDACMKGSFIEVCLNQNFVVGGNYPAPKGYHPCSIGAILGIETDPDKDGWTVGSPEFMGDYVAPGDPFEGWTLKVDTHYSHNYSFSTPSATIGAFYSSYSSGSKKFITHIGNFQGIEITHNAIIDTNKMYLLFNVSLKNTSSKKLNNIFYSRAVDPDNEVCHTKDHVTKMKIDNQLPNIKQHVTVSAIGNKYNSYFAYHTRDCRARVIIDTISYRLKMLKPDSLYFATPSGRILNKEGDTITKDVGMAITFNLGDLDTNEVTSFSYAYVMDEKEIDSIFYDEVRPRWIFDSKEVHNRDTIFVCDSVLYTLGIAALGSTDWTWESHPALSTTSGPANMFFAKGSTLFRAWRNDKKACSGYDTLNLYVLSDSFKAPIFLSGKTLYTTGIYKSYQWFRNDVPIIGATDSFYNSIDTGVYKVLVEGKSGCKFFTNNITITASMGIDFHKINRGEIFAYPNPAKSKIYFQVPIDVTVKLYNLSGIEIMSQNNCRELNISALQNGIYIITIFDKTGEFIAKQKIVKSDNNE